MKNIKFCRQFLSFFIVLSIILSIAATQALAVNAAETENAMAPLASGEVIYPISGSTSGHSTTTATLRYKIENEGAYRIDYVYWTEEGPYTNCKVTWRHESTGTEIPTTFYNSPNSNSSANVQLLAGYYTVTLEKYQSYPNTRFYYTFNLFTLN